MYKTLFFNSFVSNLILVIMILLSLAFLTLVERKVLGGIQMRKGPNKILLKGMFQPFSDAVKLLSKEVFFIKNLNYLIYLISPCLSMVLMLMMWISLPNLNNLFYMDLGILMFLCYLSVGVYSMMLSGWSSNSLYSMLGSIRAVAQSVSYEVSLILIILSCLVLVEGFKFKDLFNYQELIWFSSGMFIIMLMFLVSVVAELNRSPFDLAEGESELVSGFNTEYMSGGFVLIFMAEYGMIILMSFIVVMFYFGGEGVVIKIFFGMILIILFRGAFPRVRYDKLMMLIWKSFLLVILNLLIYINFIKWMILIFY